ncbi:pro-sigmaK processing inhibitor BofA family protein [Desulforamulus hydrothermalis]|uniref:Pro-sigmaK processing inhibitor BofA n=1 Tax=Desulforamulus hydrothermalis Lam5 = DSM 18033 TaxID=1121428 RepID=K8EIV2_9FIRM|nr:pro-sigmaK processing inhibitor BofA family protein [Desulforamulus hydrothermalis]CCO08541.1 Pro-sigmaK processing inhibitor BofA [Desulforamulus hydrothermalis Lam5 = DSM 18033]SHH02585.1 inhibitor of the pro-sigma K processing machinery [Desulforamulus hydrothermalis Lam5 = DSM 18033]
MEGKTILLSLLGLLGLYLFGTIFARPLILLGKLVVSLAVGGIMLVLVNVLLGGLGLHIAINPFTLLTAGILQVPGVVLLMLANYLLL